MNEEIDQPVTEPHSIVQRSVVARLSTSSAAEGHLIVRTGIGDPVQRTMPSFSRQMHAPITPDISIRRGAIFSTPIML